jgi:hypothetical protein
MPKKYKTVRHTGAVTRAQARALEKEGAGLFKDIGKLALKGAKFLKKTKLLSKGLALVPDKRFQHAGKVAGALGFGLQTPGSGLKLAGAGKRKPRKMK